MLFLIRLLLRVLFRVRVLGDLAPFGHADRLLIVANHHSRLDAVMLALFLPRNPVVVVPPDEVRGWFTRWLLDHVRHEALDLNNPLSMKRVLRLLRAGHPVVLFPEGRMVDNGAVMKIYPVPALIALKSGASVLPVHVEGAVQWFSRSGSASLPGRWLPSITLRVFSPTRIDGGPAGSARRRRAFATRRLATVMQTMAVQSHANKPLFECFLDAVSAHGRQALLMEDQGDKPYSYGDILRMSLALSRPLRRLTADRENIGILLPNVVSAVAVIMALSAIRRVPAIFNYSAGPLAVESARIAADVRTVITSRRFIEQAHLQSLLDALPGCGLIYLEDLRSQFGFADKLWLIGFAMRLPRLAIARQSTLDPAVVLFTSGSEDRPKGRFVK